LVRDRAEAGTRGELKRERVGIDRQEDAAPHRLTGIVGLQ
jgi:hypothetical protein